ncbi:MAG: hypothetical protein FD129_3397, partial [bacterium]
MPCLTVKMDGAHAAKLLERALSRRLGPPVAIQIRQKTVLAAPVDVHRAAEGRLGEDCLEGGAGPVVTPLRKEAFLSGAEKLQTGEVDGVGIVRRIVDVIRAGTHLWDLPGRPALELAVLQDREVDSAHPKSSEVDGDAAFERGGIHRVRQMPGLLAL